MAVTLQTTGSAVQETSPVALIPALAGSFAQIIPVIQDQQKHVQQLAATFKDALGASEEGRRQLQAKVIAMEAQQAAERAASAAREKALQELVDTVLQSNKALLERVTVLEKNAREAHLGLGKLTEAYNSHQHSYRSPWGPQNTYALAGKVVPEPKFDDQKAP